MEHPKAMEFETERYLLGEMTEAERAAFEEHFFGCPECAQSVRDGASFVAGYRALQREAAQKTPAAPPRYTWIAAAAIVVLALSLAYESAVVIPRLRNEAAIAAQPRVLASHSLLMSGTRSEGDAVAVRNAREPFSLFLDIPPDPPFAHYRCELRDAHGSVRASYDVTAAQAKEPVQLYVPGGRLTKGRCSVEVSGINGARVVHVASFPFDVTD